MANEFGKQEIFVPITVMRFAPDGTTQTYTTHSLLAMTLRRFLFKRFGVNGLAERLINAPLSRDGADNVYLGNSELIITEDRIASSLVDTINVIEFDRV